MCHLSFPVLVEMHSCVRLCVAAAVDLVPPTQETGGGAMLYGPLVCSGGDGQDGQLPTSCGENQSIETIQVVEKYDPPPYVEVPCKSGLIRVYDQKIEKTDTIIREISRRCSSSWKMLARAIPSVNCDERLFFVEEDISRIDRDCRKCEECCNTMLNLWLEDSPLATTVTLFKALRDIGKLRTAIELFEWKE